MEENRDMEIGTNPEMEEEKGAMEDDLKMVIVMRRDLHMRKGKIAAQAGHACVEAVLKALAKEEDQTGDRESDLSIWLSTGEKKICVYVDGEERLLEIGEQLKSRGVDCALIQDAGHTEFHGEATLTCLATVPASSRVLDPVTGQLPLY